MQVHRNLQVEPMDVTNETQVAAVASALRGRPIDVLINNAGVYAEQDGSFATQSVGKFNFSLLDRILAVNVKGPLIVSQAFLSNIEAGRDRKIIAISSTNGSLTQPFPGSGGTFYRASKAALNRAMQVLADELKAQRITVLLIHPGMVRTERHIEYRARHGWGTIPGLEPVDTPVSVQQMIQTIETASWSENARFVNYDGAELPW